MRVCSLLVTENRVQAAEQSCEAEKRCNHRQFLLPWVESVPAYYQQRRPDERNNRYEREASRATCDRTAGKYKHQQNRGKQRQGKTVNTGNAHDQSCDQQAQESD
jgi:hypothetical protein